MKPNTLNKPTKPASVQAWSNQTRHHDCVGAVITSQSLGDGANKYMSKRTNRAAAKEMVMFSITGKGSYFSTKNLFTSSLNTTASTSAKIVQLSKIPAKVKATLMLVKTPTVRSPIKGLVGQFRSRSRFAVPPARKEAAEKYYHGGLTTHSLISEDAV